MNLARFLPDKFLLAMAATVTMATVLPASGAGARILEPVTVLVVGLLFFLHGAKLAREAVWAGVGHWRLHLCIFLSTFVLFPILGWGLRPLLVHLVTPSLYWGVLFLCALPSTVQSAITFTAIARGNMAAAVCSASLSTLIGVVLTPVLVGLLLQHGHGVAAGGSVVDAILKIFVELVLPFVVGHLLRPWLGGFLQRHDTGTRLVDQGSILLIVYAAFSAAVMDGLWQHTPWQTLLGLLLVCGILLGVALSLTTGFARRVGFSTEDEITLVFCGSKKSLASGVPMAKVLFASSAVGALVLPLMMYHQLQIMVCAVLAQRYARRAE